MLPLELAVQKLLDEAKVVTTERIPLTECFRRIVAERIISDSNLPPFDRSPLDGYALIANEVAGASRTAPVSLTLIETVPAGAYPIKSVTPGTTARIMTGAPIPPGATGIVRLEDTQPSDNMIQFFAGAGAGKNICLKGEEIAVGDTVFNPGTKVTAAVMGVLAALGISRPLVYRKPRVALIATGSEVIGLDLPLTIGKIRNSNSYMLSAQVAEAGAEAQLVGETIDSVEAIAAMIQAAESFDVVVTTGGASVGDYDLIASVYAKLGIPVLFDRVGIKPGMPAIAGVKAGRLYLGLSGNPAAASIAFEQLVRPVLLKMSGSSNLQRQRLKARLLEPYIKTSDVRRYVWAEWMYSGEEAVVRPLGLQGNGMLRSACDANALIEVPAGILPLKAGALVDIHLL